MDSKIILPLADPQASLDLVGGKGASLARLAGEGFSVPDGFHLTTAAYQQFVEANQLQEQIQVALTTANPALIETLEAASLRIVSSFRKAPIPLELRKAITEAYHQLSGNDPVVAVRSSATAEDLPGLSFAGQQETYLNIHGVPDVLDAVRRCWASLWTARAIGYRAQHDIPSDSVRLAVVVQKLVNAEAAGVMFTANPSNGRRDQAVITAAWGLGESIVGGLVTPDTLVVDKTSGMVAQREIADKAVMTVRLNSGTQEQPVPDPLRKAAVLTDAQATDLERIGSRIEKLYQMPMDIEWAIEDEKLFIVQARPITALPEPQVPAPDTWLVPNPKGRYGRGSIIDLLPDPLTPLFRTLGGKIIEHQTFLLYKRVAGITSWPFSLFVYVNDYAYMTMSYPPRELLKLMWAGFGQFSYIFKVAERDWRDDAHPRYIQTIERWQPLQVGDMQAETLLEGAREIFAAAVYTYTILQGGLIPAASSSEMMFTQVYQRLIKKPQDPPAATFLLGFESAPIRAEKTLYDLAMWAKEQPGLASYLSERRGSQIAADLQAGKPPADITAESWQELTERFDAYLAQYGSYLYDLDFSKPTQAEDPGTLLDTLRLYISGGSRSPYERVEKLASERCQAVINIQDRIKGLKRKWFLQTLRRAQKFAPLREEGMADLGLGFPLLRRLFLELGRRLVKDGSISHPEDIFWLEEEEAQQAAAALDTGQPFAGMQEIIKRRKAKWTAEKRVSPPTMLPVGSRFMGIDVGSFGARTEGQDGDTLKGAGAFPGRITGVARVLHGPEDFSQMQPGDILVAAITTPAWTPLFAKAAAIVTDIGGPLSHSSIVAREYGIPAVLGTGVATRRITSGQIITVDGSAGLVSLKNGQE